MITTERIQELVKLVEDWHYQSSDGDILLELVKIVKQQQAVIEELKQEKLSALSALHTVQINTENPSALSQGQLAFKADEINRRVNLTLKRLESTK